MQLSDLTVEVRDKSLTRLGTILHEDLDFELTNFHNNVGTWHLTLAVEHPLCAALRVPGAGLIVTGPADVLCSGPVVTPEFAATADEPVGTVVFSGVTDTVALADALAWPQPSNSDVQTQTLAHDDRTGPAETLMHQYVAANIGTSASVARRKAGLINGTDLARGPVVRKKARFPVLGELLNELAVLANLGFRIVQRGNNLVFETYEVEDLTEEIRLDVYNNTLAGQRVAMSPPGLTHAIVAGQGDLVERQFLNVSTAESVLAMNQWGRRIERFIDQRQTEDWDELQQAGDEVLAEEGFTSVAVQAIPMDDSSMRFGTDWDLGDSVSVTVEGEELKSIVTGYKLKANSSGFKLGALLGESVQFDGDAAISKRVGSAESRISSLEREGTATGGAPEIHEHVEYAPVAHSHNYAAPEHTHEAANGAWITLPLLNGWVSLGASYEPPAYMKDAQGFVHMRGLVHLGTTGVIANLPAGYRIKSAPGGLSTPAAFSIVICGGSFATGSFSGDGNVGVNNTTSYVDLASYTTFLAEG